MDKNLINVYFDGKCGLCKKEIAHYKKVCPKETFLWLDIAHNPEYLSEISASQIQALKRLHVLDGNKKLHIGLDAFLKIWVNIPKYKVLGWLCALPLVYNVLKILYNTFADLKFSRSAHCKILES